MKCLGLTVIYLTLISCVGSQPVNFPTVSIKKTQRIGSIQNSDLSESSGLYHSLKNRQVLWSHNDSGDAPMLYALSTTGRHLSKFRLNNTTNRDWEDMAGFRKNGVDYIIIADIGDNESQYAYYRILIVKEPSASGFDPHRVQPLKVERVIRFQYEDGSRDSESVAVDPQGNIYILSKRDKPAVLYKLSWDMDEDRIYIAKKIVKLAGLPANKNVFTPFRHQPTAMDMSRDGRRLVVLTYGYAYLYHRGDDNWSEVLKGRPRMLPRPKLKQAESICFGSQGAAIYIGSERRGSPLVKIDL